MDSSSLMMGVAIVQVAAKRQITDEMSLEDKAKICYGESFKNDNTWFVSNSDLDQVFRIGTGALMMLLGEEHEDYEKVRKTLNALQALSAAISGIPVDFERVAANKDQLLPLRSWFMQMKEKMEGERKDAG